MGKLSKLPALLAALDTPAAVMSFPEIVRDFGEATFRKGRALGVLEEILPGLYVRHDRAMDFNTRLAACSRWLNGRGAISGLAACVLHGLEPRRFARVEIVIDRKRRSPLPVWIDPHVVTHVVPHHEVKGHLAVTVECALIEATRKHGLGLTRGLIIDAIRDKKSDANRILGALVHVPRMAHRREFIAFLGELKNGIQSYLEDLADRTVFNVPELQGLERQVVFWVDGSKYVVDAFDRETMTAIELDSRKHHGSEEARRRDIERDAALASIGVQTLRFTFEHIQDRPLHCRKRILATIAARRRRTAA